MVEAKDSEVVVVAEAAVAAAAATAERTNLSAWKNIQERVWREMLI
jgi:hypothetical protein